MGGMISAYKKLQTKSGLYMAFVTVEDMYGTIECVCFPKTYDRIKNFLEADRVVTISGKIDISEEKAPVIIVDRMNEFLTPEQQSQTDASSAQKEDAQKTGGGSQKTGAERLNETEKEKRLWLNVTGLDERDLAELTDTLVFYAGNTTVIFVDKAKNARYECSQKVTVSRALFAELSTCLTEDRIKLL